MKDNGWSKEFLVTADLETETPITINLTSDTAVGSERYRPLVFDAGAHNKIKTILDYSHKPENYYRPHLTGARVPGDVSEHRCLLNTYRCVYSVTQVDNGVLLRHLSVSVPGTKYPALIAVLMIATEFGFTGWNGTVEELPSDWMASAYDRCVTIAQRLP